MSQMLYWTLQGTQGKGANSLNDKYITLYNLQITTLYKSV